jgi:nicotinate-nucleotide adenylyltransferase
MKKIMGILGGTFDPIHAGHIGLCETLLSQFPIEEIRLIPCKTPVHRITPIASAEDRLDMLKLAISSNKQLIADDCELKREDDSYTIDTLLDLKQRFDQPLALIIGYDAWEHFLSWHRYDDILKLAHVIIVKRPHYELPKTGALADLLKQHQTQPFEKLQDSPNGLIYVDDQTDFDVSATELRAALANHQTTDLISKEVSHYINEHKLYSTTENS